MSIFDEPKIDCHNHVFDPARFEFSPKAAYLPAGAEIGTRSQLSALFAAYGVQQALVVQPNSGYADDNRCLIDVLARAEGRFRGMAVVANDVSRRELERLRALRIIGVTVNAALLGTEYYASAARLLADLGDLGMFVDLQVQADQLVDMLPLLDRTDARVVVDHCGRPRPGAGLDQPGFTALLRLAATGRVFVKISGYAKFSAQPYPYRDAWPYVHSLIQAFGTGQCVWGSDWPFLRAPERIDYGPLLKLIEHLVPDPADRSELLWHTPNRLFGFADPPPPPPLGAHQAAGG
jgi:predicted TIM-barrel fold metal-dependent hydrolase